MKIQLRRLLTLPPILAASCFCLTHAAHATLLSYWDFNNDSVTYNVSSSTIGSFSTSAASYGETYSSASATLSSNTNGTVFNGSNIYIDFSNLSSGVTQPITNGLVYNSSTQATVSSSYGGFGVYSDTTTNRASGDASVGGSLFILNSLSSENNHYITLSLDSAGYDSLALSYASRVTSGASCSEIWSYSLDGTTWTSLATESITGTGAFVAYNIDLSSLSSGTLDDQGTFYLRMTLSTTAGSIAFDNIQLTGSANAIPEPATCALLGGLGALGFAFIARRRRR